MKHFKIVYGYQQDEYLEITENELAKAIAIFMDGNGRAMFASGAIRGQDIMRIVPDVHKQLGINRSCKLLPEDYAEFRKYESPYRETYEQAKALAGKSIAENKPELLSKPLQKVLATGM